MSYQDYQKAVTIIEKNADILIKTYPQQKAAIDKAENILNIKFPKSYKKFLEKYGVFVSKITYIYGLNYQVTYDEYIFSNIICNTLDERQINEDPPFPPSFVVFYDLGNGEKFCLDTAKMNAEGECPIVCWSFGNIESIEDDFGKDFGEFFLNVIVRGLPKYEQEGGVVNW